MSSHLLYSMATTTTLPTRHPTKSSLPTACASNVHKQRLQHSVADSIKRYNTLNAIEYINVLQRRLCVLCAVYIDHRIQRQLQHNYNTNNYYGEYMMLMVLYIVCLCIETLCTLQCDAHHFRARSASRIVQQVDV